jgi:hypothetical protein
VAATESAKRGDVQDQVPDFEDIPRFRYNAAAQRAHAREEFGQRKRLCKVIVRAGVQALYDVRQGVPGRQHQDRNGFLTAAELAGDFDSIYSREHYVEKNYVERVLIGELESGEAVACNVHFVGIFAQALREKLRHVRIVFDYQDIHWKFPREMIEPGL